MMDDGCLQRGPAPRGRVPASRGRVPAPRGRVPAPRGRVPAPRGRVPASRGRVPASRGRVPASRGRVYAPRVRVDAPRVRVHAPPTVAGQGIAAPDTTPPPMPALHWIQQPALSSLVGRPPTLSEYAPHRHQQKAPAQHADTGTLREPN
jgi:hypothetical protein